MKILELRDFGNADGTSPPTFILTTDSSMTRGNRPVFLPGISQRWRCDFSVAYLVSRLGKSIAERFAPRYYDMMTLCVRFVPLDIVVPEEGAAERWTPWATAFDGALAMGSWIGAAPVSEIRIASPHAMTSGDVTSDIDRSIRILSYGMMIKTGDIIIPPSPVFQCGVETDDRVEACINGQEVLKFSIK